MKTLITGASKGIGKDLAFEFASKDHDLVLVARSIELLENLKLELENKFQIKVDTYSCDLSNEEQRKELLQNHDFSSVEILVNNAGFGDFSFFPEADLEKQQNMIDLNVKALVHLSHHFAQLFLKKSSGKILNIASTAAFCPGPMMATYFATKAFVLSFSQALSTELKDKGITVTCVCPGPTHSDFGKRANVDNSLAFRYAMDGKELAKIAYKELEKNKVVSVAGTKNKALMLIRKFLPSGLVAKINQAILAQSK